MDHRPPSFHLHKDKEGFLARPNPYWERRQNGIIQHWMYHCIDLGNNLKDLNERIASREVRMLHDGDYDDSDYFSSLSELKKWRKQITKERNYFLGKITENTC